MSGKFCNTDGVSPDDRIQAECDSDEDFVAACERGYNEAEEDLALQCLFEAALLLEAMVFPSHTSSPTYVWPRCFALLTFWWWALNVSVRRQKRCSTISL